MKKAAPAPPDPAAAPCRSGFRIGFLAPEFPPQLGGIAEFARGVAQGLAQSDDLTVYTDARAAPGTDTPGGPVPLLTGRPVADAGRLAAARADLWLAFNAGLVPLAARLERPFFCLFHGNDFLSPWLPCGPGWLERLERPYAARLRHALRRRAIRRTHGSVRHLFTNSRHTARLAQERLGIAAGRISVVPPGVDDRFFRRRAGGGGGPLRLLTVCRLTRYSARKNVDGVLRALALLGERLPVRYTVIGGGDDRPRLEALAGELGIGERVSFLGTVSPERLAAAYAAADLFVLAAKASRLDVEGFGIVYLEAAAAGVPSLCSREGGATEAVEDGWNGLIIPTSSPADIAAGIARFAAARGQFEPDRVRAFAERFRWREIVPRLRREMLARSGLLGKGSSLGGQD